MPRAADRVVVEYYPNDPVTRTVKQQVKKCYPDHYCDVKGAQIRSGIGVYGQMMDDIQDNYIIIGR